MAGADSNPALRRMAARAHGSVSISIACSQSRRAASACPDIERAVPRLNQAFANTGDSSTAREKSSTAGPYCPPATSALPRLK